MADKMMRIAGRDEDGFAKAIKTDLDGNLKVKLTDDSAGYEYSTDSHRVKVINMAEVKIVEDARELAGKKTAVIYSRATYAAAPTAANIMVPNWARGFILTTIIRGVTGTFTTGQGMNMFVEFRSAFADLADWSDAWIGSYATGLTVRSNVAGKNHTIICYPEAIDLLPANVISSVASHSVLKIPLGESLAIGLNINGTFTEGQGFDIETQILWLP